MVHVCMSVRQYGGLHVNQAIEGQHGLKRHEHTMPPRFWLTFD
jgi:hypothetical protein